MTSAPSTPRPLTARGRARREQILESAADLMADRGYPAVSLAITGDAESRATAMRAVLELLPPGTAGK